MFHLGMALPQVLQQLCWDWDPLNQAISSHLCSQLLRHLGLKLPYGARILGICHHIQLESSFSEDSCPRHNQPG